MAFEKIKRSEHRKNIERMLAQGISPRKIASWLKSNGESISYLLIHQYKQQEFNFTAAALAELEPVDQPELESQQLFEAGKRSVLHDIGFCNRVISLAEAKVASVSDDPVSHARFRTFTEAAFRAIEIKRKIAEGAEREPTTINIDFKQLKIEITEELARLEELEVIETKKISTR